ncbi:MAG: tetratricopeptide repeat protein [Blastocatellia bacterium]
MLIRSLIAFAAIFSLLSFSHAQSNVSTAEEKAYRAAVVLAASPEKIAALDKFLAAYPKSSLRVLAHRTMLETLLEVPAEQKDRFLAHAQQLLAAASDSTRGNWLNLIAGMLLEKGVWLDEAERLAQESVAQLGDRKNLKQSQQVVAGGRVAVTSNVPRLVTLGRIYLQRGKMKEAETLLKEAAAADALLVSTLLGLGELAAAKGDQKTALRYFADAYLSGRGREPARKRVEAAYRKVYPTKPEELEIWLDAKYQKDAPNPIKVEAYKPTAARTNRVVLAEVFSGSSCAPCIATDLAVEAALKRYSTKELAVLMYHVQIPDLDPLTNPTGEARQDFYGARVAPLVYVNGALQRGLGGYRDKAEESWAKLTPVIDKALDAPSEAAIRISAMRQGPTIKVKLGIEKIRSNASTLRLHLALVEDEVRYTGVNGIRFHPMVVRAMAGEKAAGWAVKADETPAFEHTFEVQKIEAATKTYLDEYELNGRALPVKFEDKKHAIDVNKLSLVAFLQDPQTKQILQAVFLKLPAADKFQ